MVTVAPCARSPLQDSSGLVKPTVPSVAAARAVPGRVVQDLGQVVDHRGRVGVRPVPRAVVAHGQGVGHLVAGVRRGWRGLLLGQHQVPHRVGRGRRRTRRRLARLTGQRVGQDVVALVGERPHRDLVGHRAGRPGRDRARHRQRVAGTGRVKAGALGDRAVVERGVVQDRRQVISGVDGRRRGTRACCRRSGCRSGCRRPRPACPEPGRPTCGGSSPEPGTDTVSQAPPGPGPRRPGGTRCCPARGRRGAVGERVGDRGGLTAGQGTGPRQGAAVDRAVPTVAVGADEGRVVGTSDRSSVKVAGGRRCSRRGLRWSRPRCR